MGIEGIVRNSSGILEDYPVFFKKCMRFLSLVGLGTQSLFFKKSARHVVSIAIPSEELLTVPSFAVFGQSIPYFVRKKNGVEENHVYAWKIS